MKVIANTNELSREQWLELRKTGIGGSDAGTILGVNPYSSPYALWASKTGLVEDTFKGNAATDWGNRLERTVAEAFAQETNKAVVEWPVMLQGEKPWQLANVDFFIVDKPEWNGAVTTVEDMGDLRIEAILECKTTGIVGRGNARAWENNGVPTSYFWQGAHYSLVTGVHTVFFACLIGSVGLVIRERNYEQETLGQLLEAEANFWELIQKKSAPDLTGADAEFEVLKALYPESTGTSVEVSEWILDRLADYRQAKAELDEAEAKVKAARVELEAAIADADEATYQGRTLFTYKSNKCSAKFDDKRFREEYPELYNQYLVERQGARVLRLKGE